MDPLRGGSGSPKPLRSPTPRQVTRFDAHFPKNGPGFRGNCGEAIEQTRAGRCNRPQVGAESPNDIRAIHEILASSGTDHSRLRLERETLTTSASQYPVESGLIRRELTIAIEFAFATSIQIWRVRKLRRLYGLPRYAARNELSLRIADGYDLA